MAKYTVLTSAQIERTEEHLGRRLKNVHELSGGMANSSFLAEAPEGQLVITVLDNHDMESASRLAALMTYLANRGVPTQRVCLGRSGASVIEVDGKPVMVREFIDGVHEEPVPPEGLRDVGSLLAHVHRVPPPANIERGTRRLPVDWRQRVGDDAPADLVALLRRAESLQVELEPLQHVLVHGDLFADNLVLTPDGRRIILDWETASIEPAILDIGVAAVAMCRTANRLDDARLDRLLDGYRSADGQLPAPDLIRASVECANALLAFHRYYRHNVRFPDPARDSIHQELVAFGRSLI